MLKFQKIAVTVVILGAVSGSTAIAADDMVLGDRASSGTKLNLTESGTRAEAVPDNTGSASLRVAGFLLLLIGVGGGALVLVYKRRNAVIISKKAGTKLEILERLPLGGQRECVLMKACDRLLVVGMHAGQFTLLSDMATEDSPTQPFARMASVPAASHAVTDSVSIPDTRAVRSAMAAAYQWPESENVR